MEMNNMQSLLLRSNKKGFTLTELLVAIGIIAFLGVLTIVYLRTQVFKGNDARRKAEMKRIAIAVEEYEKDKDCYPTTVTCTTNTTLRPYLDTIPCDPVSKTPYYYEHDGTSCPKWYRIYATLENTADKDYEAGIGLGAVYSYYQSSPNAPEVVPSPVTPPPATNTPIPPVSDIFYGCFSGVCQQISEPYCTPKYGASGCYGQCSNPDNQCI